LLYDYILYEQETISKFLSGFNSRNGEPRLISAKPKKKRKSARSDELHLFSESSVVDPDPYFLGLPDPDQSLFCTDPDTSISKQKEVRKTLISTTL
jgi:hypothetical protein